MTGGASYTDGGGQASIPESLISDVVEGSALYSLTNHRADIINKIANLRITKRQEKSWLIKRKPEFPGRKKLTETGVEPATS